MPNPIESRNTPSLSVSPDVRDLLAFHSGRFAWDVDHAFSEIVQKKRLTIVGPARTLIGSNKGKWIDSHDVVIRFNDAFEYFADPQRFSVDIGSRTDVLYCNQVILRKNILESGTARNRFARFARETNLKCVVCTNNSLSYSVNGDPAPGCEARDREVLKHFSRFLAEEAPGTTFRVVMTASSLLIKWLNGNWGRTGFIALVDLLGFQPLHLNVTGMTFYHGGGHISTNGPELHPLRNRDGSSSISPDGFGHNSFLELDALRKLVAVYDPLIGIDETLRSLIDTEGHTGT